jgi:flagellar assembly protein FliH
MASVLKSTSPAAEAAARPPSGLAGFNLDDLSQQARRQLLACQQEMARLRAQTAAELETLRQAAQEQGLAEGHRQAALQAQSELKAALDARIDQHSAAAESMVQQIAELHQSWMQQYADALVAMVIAVSQRVIRGRLDREPEIVLRWTREALAAARSASRLTIAVHPETLGQLGPALDELLAQPGLPEETFLIPDESVPTAGVVVRQVGGEVVATLQSQLARLEELLESA